MRHKAGATELHGVRLIWIGFFAAAMGLAAVVGVWGRVESPAAIAAHLQAAGSALALWRLGLGLLIVFAWPRWVGVLARVYRLSPARQTELARLRWRVAAWLIVLELILVQGVAVRALGPWAG